MLLKSLPFIVLSFLFACGSSSTNSSSEVQNQVSASVKAEFAKEFEKKSDLNQFKKYLNLKDDNLSFVLFCENLGRNNKLVLQLAKVSPHALIENILGEDYPPGTLSNRFLIHTYSHNYEKQADTKWVQDLRDYDLGYRKDFLSVYEGGGFEDDRFFIFKYSSKYKKIMFARIRISRDVFGDKRSESNFLKVYDDRDDLDFPDILGFGTCSTKR